MKLLGAPIRSGSYDQAAFGYADKEKLLIFKRRLGAIAIILLRIKAINITGFLVNKYKNLSFGSIASLVQLIPLEVNENSDFLNLPLSFMETK